MAGVTRPDPESAWARLSREPKIIESITSQCFPKQLAYVTDRSPRTASLCSRKAGKTGGKVRKLVMTALRAPESIAVYCATTIKSSMAAIWDNPDGLPTWLRKNRIDCKMYAEGLVEFPNGSMIRVTGADNKKTIDVWRSIRADLWEFDESQAFEDGLFKYILEDVVPATQIVRGGQVSLGGTPDRRCRGHFYEVTTGKIPGWSVHHWTWRDNPHLRNAQAWIEQEKRDRGLTEGDPAFRREFNGEWVREDSMLAYHFDAAQNLYGELPVAPEWTNILGIDVGFNDSAAFSLGCYHSHSPVYFVREVYQEKRCTVSRYDEIITSYKAQAASRGEEINKIVMDCGALGKTIAESIMETRHHLIIPAEKTEKRAWMAMLNDALRTGNLKLHPKRCAELVSQWNTLQVDDEGAEDQTMANDLSDATLYAFRHARPYLFQAAPEPRPHPGRRPQVDPEVIAARMQARAEEYVERQQSQMSEINGLLGEYESIGDGLFE